MEEVIEQFAEIFCKSLRMLSEEIEENKENLNNFNDVDELVDEWNSLYEKYFEEGEWEKMKYHEHEIIKSKCEDDCVVKYKYDILKDKKYINSAYSLGNAKEYIDSKYDKAYLC